MREGIYEQNISRYSPQTSQRWFSLDPDQVNPDTNEDWLLHETSSHRIGPEDVTGIPHSMSIPSEPLVVGPRRVEPSFSKLDTFPQRRALFDDERPIETRPERSQVEGPPFMDEDMNVSTSLPQVGAPVRPHTPVDVSVGE